jgi:hypothetical protein
VPEFGRTDRSVGCRRARTARSSTSTAGALTLELSLAWSSTNLYLKPLDLADAPRARLGSGGKEQPHQRGGVLIGITKTELRGRLALACADGRPRTFLCSGCGAHLTLADRVVGAGARSSR